MTWSANRVEDGRFSSSNFYHDADFKKQLTPESQLVRSLMNLSLEPAFLQGIASPYTVGVRWVGTTEDVTYYIDQPPDPKIMNALQAC